MFFTQCLLHFCVNLKWFWRHSSLLLLMQLVLIKNCLWFPGQPTIPSQPTFQHFSSLLFCKYGLLDTNYAILSHVEGPFLHAKFAMFSFIVVPAWSSVDHSLVSGGYQLDCHIKFFILLLPTSSLMNAISVSKGTVIASSIAGSASNVLFLNVVNFNS